MSYFPIRRRTPFPECKRLQDLADDREDELYLGDIDGDRGGTIVGTAKADSTGMHPPLYSRN
jgi:hypothetical protein